MRVISPSRVFNARRRGAGQWLWARCAALDPHSLLRSADVAGYAAKEAHAPYKIYAARLDHHSVRRLNEFRDALAADEIKVFYQPIIIHIDGARAHGAEALVRWQHSELGLLPPSDFISIVEQTPLIGLLTRHARRGA